MDHKINNSIDKDINSSADKPTEFLYEVVIAAIDQQVVSKFHPGHIILGIIKTTKLFRGGKELVTRQYMTLGTDGKIVPTVVTAYQGFNQVFSKDFSIQVIKGGYKNEQQQNAILWDIRELINYYNQGVPKYRGSWCYVRKTISEKVFYEVWNNYNVVLAKYHYYNMFSNIVPIPYTCHCGDIAAHLFFYTTGDKRYKMGFLGTTPRMIYKKITVGED